MRSFLFVVMLPLLVAMLCVPVSAKDEPLHHFEVYRSQFGYGYGLAINPTDGTVWACIGDSLYHYGTDNTLLSKTELWWPQMPCVNASDGSCWVVEAGEWWDTTRTSSLVQVAADGTVLRTLPGIPGQQLPTQCGPDGSLWVADLGDWYGQLRRISSTGETLATLSSVNDNTGGFASPEVNSADGTCWVAFLYFVPATDYCELLHVGLAGEVLGDIICPNSSDFQWRRRVAPNGSDGSVWWTDLQSNEVVHDSAGGEEFSRTPIPWGGQLTVNPSDGSCWAAGPRGWATSGQMDRSFLLFPARVPSRILPLALFGGQSGQITRPGSPASPMRLRRNFVITGRTVVNCGPRESILEPHEPNYDFHWDEADRTFWTWNDDRDLVRVTQMGEELYRHAPFTDSWEAEAFNSSDGSITLVNGSTGTALQIARDGTERSISLNYNPLPAFASNATAFAANSHDGSYWVSLRDGRTTSNPKTPVPSIFHLAADGTGLGEIAATGAYHLVVDPADDSLWVSETYPAIRLAHFSSDGTELWHDPNPSGGDLSVDSTDSSLWVLSSAGILRFAKDGTQIESVPLPPFGVEMHGGAGDPVTGFYWFAYGPYVSVYSPAANCSGRTVDSTEARAFRSVSAMVRSGCTARTKAKSSTSGFRSRCFRTCFTTTGRPTE